jgi:hypothetical protein
LQAKVKPAQREEIKVIIKEWLLRRLERKEIVDVVNDRLKLRHKKKVNIWDIDRYRRSIKSEAKTWMKVMLKSRHAYIVQYKERINEYLNYQKHLWNLFIENPDKPFLQKSIIDSLMDTSAAISQLYVILPEIVGESYGDIRRKDIISESKEGTERKDSPGNETDATSSGTDRGFRNLPGTETIKGSKTDSPPAF